jgi:hypothetical protein
MFIVVGFIGVILCWFCVRCCCNMYGTCCLFLYRYFVGYNDLRTGSQSHPPTKKTLDLLGLDPHVTFSNPNVDVEDMGLFPDEKYIAEVNYIQHSILLRSRCTRATMLLVVMSLSLQYAFAQWTAIIDLFFLSRWCRCMFLNLIRSV